MIVCALKLGNISSRYRGTASVNFIMEVCLGISDGCDVSNNYTDTVDEGLKFHFEERKIIEIMEIGCMRREGEVVLYLGSVYGNKLRPRVGFAQKTLVVLVTGTRCPD